MIETRYVKSHHAPQFWKRKLHKSSIIVAPNCPYSDKLISNKCLFISAIGAHKFRAHVRDLVGLKAIRMTDTNVWYIRIILVPRGQELSLFRPSSQRKSPTSVDEPGTMSYHRFGWPPDPMSGAGISFVVGGTSSNFGVLAGRISSYIEDWIFVVAISIDILNHS